jgi:hypothetical protein
MAAKHEWDWPPESRPAVRGDRMRLPYCARESGIGPSRHFATVQQFGRFRREADIAGLTAGSTQVENDPMQTSWVGGPFNYEARLHRGKAQIVDVTDRWKLNGESFYRAPSLNVR